jgi:hypothetical protein
LPPEQDAGSERPTENLKRRGKELVIGGRNVPLVGRRTQTVQVARLPIIRSIFKSQQPSKPSKAISTGTSNSGLDSFLGTGSENRLAPARFKWRRPIFELNRIAGNSVPTSLPRTRIGRAGAPRG